MELYISDHPLDCLTCAANGDCELQDMAGAVGLREVRYGYDGAKPSQSPSSTSPTPISPTIRRKCIVCSRCVRACEEVQGTFALTIEGRGFELAWSRRAWTSRSCSSECVSCGACVQACPTGDADREIGHRDRQAGTFGGHHLRLLRRRLRLQGGNARRRGGAHGAVQGRQGQSRAFLRQGPLRLGLRQPPGPHPEADDPREDHRSVARSELGGGDRPRRLGVQAHPGEVRARLDRRHHLVALHRRRNLPGAEAGPRRLRQQQHRHLRARLPLADRLRPEHDLRHLGRHAGFRFRRARRRHHADRRQPDRRASGVRLAHEEAAARRARS